MGGNNLPIQFHQLLALLLLLATLLPAETPKELESAIDEVDRLFNQTEDELRNAPFLNSPLMDPLGPARRLWAVHTLSLGKARERAFGAQVALAITRKMNNNNGKLLPSREMLDAAVQATCLSAKESVAAAEECDQQQGAYRQIDGRCNHPEMPELGATFGPFQRLLPPDYADGISEPRRSSAAAIGSHPLPLPNARLLSNLLFREPPRPSSVPLPANSLVAHWAALVHADLVQIGSAQLAPVLGEPPIPLPCCAMENALGPPGAGRPAHPECFPITIGSDDPKYRGLVNCMDYARTLPAPRSANCSLGAREQANQATSFLDASFLYGSIAERSRRLRSFRDGKLVASREDGPNSQARQLPPSLEMLARGKGAIGWGHCANNAPSTCFGAGTAQVNFLPSLAALDALWLRQHNAVAGQLMSLNKGWSDEQLFQEARRIVIAQLQLITFGEWLPLVIGRENWNRAGLNPFGDDTAEEDDFGLAEDPSTLNEYAAAAGMFFMTMLESRFAHLEPSGVRSMERPLSEWMYEPSALMFSQRLDGVFRFLLRQPAQPVGLHASAELRQRFLRPSGAAHGLDWAALLLQMGRDHGIAGYTRWRQFCAGDGVPPIQHWEQMAQAFADPRRVLPILARHFRKPQDVDLLLGGLAERPLKGALLGPTLSCLLARQFQKTKRGDRHWVGHRMQPWAFTDQQLGELRKTTLAQLLCANTDLAQVQPRAFEAIDEFDNFPVPCNHSMMAGPDWNAWKHGEAQVQMPFSAGTVRRALELGLERMLERRKRETDNAAVLGEPNPMITHNDALLAYAQMMRPKREALEMGKMGQVLLEATKALLKGDVNDVGMATDSSPLQAMDPVALQRILPQLDIDGILGDIQSIVNSIDHHGSVPDCLARELPCDHTSKYRTHTGWCNNLRFPHYGSAFNTLRHLLPPDYEDGVDLPRSRAISGRPLPSPRAVSNAIHIDAPHEHAKFTHMVMQFGQLLDHELTHSPVERAPGATAALNCTRCDSAQTLSANCMPLEIPDGDPFFPKIDEKGEPRCLPFARSILGQLTLGYRNQLNQLTSFIDASVVYGSTHCEGQELRAFRDGLLNSTNLGRLNPEALPQGDQEQDCRGKPRFPCFVAGDERNSHQPALTALHTVFLREHNRIARQLQIFNPHWEDEKLYQETRRIVGAILQHIVFSEYLPKLIGQREMDRHGLSPFSIGFFARYDPTCDASISHPFATAAFRFGHTMIRRFFPRLDPANYQNYSSPVDLVENFNNMEAMYDEKGGGMDTLMMGLIGARAMAFDRHITDAVRNHLFSIRGLPLSGFDLIALNIQRARDHGVQPYNALREFCGLPRLQGWADLATDMDQPSIGALQSVYESPDDIDLFPGIISERPMRGALMPPTMACLIAEQFERLKRCDRFYYENELPETRFTPEQLTEIRKIRLGSLLCQNIPSLNRIQPDVFSIPDQLSNAQIPCADFPRMNLARWMERPVCFIGNSEVARGATRLKSPCMKCTCTADGPKCKAIRVLNCDNMIANFPISEIREDMACMVQCGHHLKEKRR